MFYADWIKIVDFLLMANFCQCPLFITQTLSHLLSKIINRLNKISDIDAFVKTPKGYKTTGAEGYVAIDKLSGDAVKLVDRLEFSYNNFSPDILKGWDKPK